VRGATVAIQGFGNAGSIAAELFQAAGARIVAASDSQGGVLAGEGLDVRAAIAHKQATGGLAGLRGARSIDNAELLELECDILIPAAIESQIRLENAARVRARLVVEAANGPVTPGADRVLHERGIVVLPDILANSGGVTVSYFEWVQNIEHQRWEETAVNAELERKMRAPVGRRRMSTHPICARRPSPSPSIGSRRSPRSAASGPEAHARRRERTPARPGLYCVLAGSRLELPA
jgi:glutamate dehydrogenase/leucine dehydrogenase